MSAETADLLERAKGFVDTPEKWTKGLFHEAGAYCSIGALQAAAAAARDKPWYVAQLPEDAVVALARAKSGKPLPEDAEPWEARGAVIGYNDNPSVQHRHVMAMFDRAIEAERAVS